MNINFLSLNKYYATLPTSMLNNVSNKNLSKEIQNESVALQNY